MVSQPAAFCPSAPTTTRPIRERFQRQVSRRPEERMPARAMPATARTARPMTPATMSVRRSEGEATTLKVNKRAGSTGVPVPLPASASRLQRPGTASGFEDRGPETEDGPWTQDRGPWTLSLLRHREVLVLLDALRFLVRRLERLEDAALELHVQLEIQVERALALVLHLLAD